MKLPDIMKGIEKIDDVMQSIIISAMVITVMLQIILRLVNKPFPWTEEVTRHLFIWAVFISVGTGVRLKDHLGVSIVIDKIFRGPKGKFFIRFFSSLVSIAFYVTIIYLGVQFTIQIFNLGQRATTYNLLMGFITISIPFGFTLALIWSMYGVADIFKDMKQYFSQEADKEQ